MHVVAQCFAVGIGFAFGVAAVAMVAGTAERVFGNPLAKRQHRELMELHQRTEDRLEEYTRHMAVLAEAALIWISRQEPKP